MTYEEALEWKDTICGTQDKLEDKKFTKFDEGKTPLSLIEPDYIIGTAKILQLGAEKYGKYNWQGCGDIDRYKDALLRHIYAYLAGEKTDKESGLSHLYHASCNLMFLNYFDKDK